MAYTFAESYTFSQFLNEYVLRYLIMYPIAIVILSIVIVIVFRVKSMDMVGLVINKGKEYYTRINYRIVTAIVVSVIVCICILLLVGIIYNTTMSEEMRDTVDNVYGAVNYTSDNLSAINSSLVDLQVKLAAGFNGSSLINASQSVIVEAIDGIIDQLSDLSNTLTTFSESTVSRTAALSAEARDIVSSLQTYPQLVNVPETEEIPEIDETDITDQFNGAVADIEDSKQKLRTVQNDVSKLVGEQDYDFSGVISDITSTRQSLSDINDTVIDLYTTREDVEREAYYYDTIRIAIIVLTYIIPVVVSLAGLLAIQLRSSLVVRAWYHVLLVGAALCGIFAAVYITLAILLRDGCHDPKASLFTALRSLEPDYESQDWYVKINLYFDNITTCGDSDSMLDYLGLPADVLEFLMDPGSIVVNATGNYTGLTLDATQGLDKGLDSINSIEYDTLINATQTQAKLTDIQQQLTNLASFGFSIAEYNSALADINALTSDFTALTFKYSYFYVRANLSSLQLDQPPYLFTNQTYKNQLNASVVYFWTLDSAYQDVLNLTSSINNNVTRLHSIIDELEDSKEGLRDVQETANTKATEIRTSIDNINNIVLDLSGNIIPNYFNLTGLRNEVIEATRCKYLADRYHSAEHFICVTSLSASVAFVVTHLLNLLILLAASLVACYAWVAFRFPYKPFYSPPSISLYSLDKNNDSDSDNHYLPDSPSISSFSLKSLSSGAVKHKLDSRRYMIL